MLLTGKSFELMGLATFNLFLAMVLSVTFLSQAEKKTLNKLTETNIGAFVAETAAVTSGAKQGMDRLGIAEYLMKHLDDSGTYTSTVQIDLPDAQEPEQKLDLDKKAYIGRVLEGLGAIRNHEEKTRVENIEIADDSRSARVVTTSFERGMIPSENESGGSVLVPVRGISYCEQKLVLKDETIRMAGAVCSTSIQPVTD